MKYSVDPSISFEVVLKKLRSETLSMSEPISFFLIERFGRDPYIVLVSCILSLRTKDKITLEASLRLFSIAKTPHDMVLIPLQVLEKLIYPVGFYRRKAEHIQKINKILIEVYGGQVPNLKELLLNLPGVGIKTANLVLGLGFKIPALCVDIHVHRIANRLGLVYTKNPEQTEQALMKIFPKEHWIELNRLLVMWGQNICTPLSPYCSKCIISSLCKKNSVLKQR